MLCFICNKKVNSSDILLLNAKGIHNDCLEDIKSNDTRHDSIIQNYQSVLVELEEKRRNVNSFFNRLTNIFIGPDLNINDQILEIEKRISGIKSIIVNSEKDRESILIERKELLSKTYDFWLERPPDWEERRGLILNEESFCNACGELYSLHIHHKRQIKDGGTHKLENLEVLCEDCHSDAHGGRKFRYNKKERETKYSKHYKILLKAIEDKKPLMLNYEKYNGEKSQRVIHPKLFERWGESLIVQTHCELRNDKRNFNLIRIKKLKPIKQNS